MVDRLISLVEKIVIYIITYYITKNMSLLYVVIFSFLIETTINIVVSKFSKHLLQETKKQVKEE